ncbi:MAG: V-type ATPase 116kDa subunit family protein [Parachlamydiales bacterium]
MRDDVKKVLFVGSMASKAPFLKKAQGAGFIEFIDHRGEAGHGPPAQASRILRAKKVLRRCPPLPQQDFRRKEGAPQATDRILQLADLIEKLEEEERILHQEIVRVHVFGDFSKKEIAAIERAGRVVQFFFAKTSAHIDPSQHEGLIYVGHAFDLDYFVSIMPTEVHLEGLTEMKIERPLGELQRRLEEVKAKHHELDEELKTYAKYRHALKKALFEVINVGSLEAHQEYPAAHFGGELFVVEGWVPQRRLAELKPLTDSFEIHYEEIAVDGADRVPTCLENHGLGRVGEDLVHIYDTPSTEDRDPSYWVLWSFAFFFAVIVNDAGYGAILLAISLWVGWKFKKAAGLGKRFVKLCLIISASIVLWGFFTNAYFGIVLKPDNPLRKVSITNALVDAKIEHVIDHPDSTVYKEWVEKYPKLAETKTVDGWIDATTIWHEGKLKYDLLEKFTDNVMMELALLIGVLHLIIAFCRRLDLNWAGFGWIAFILGAYLYFPKALDATSLVHYALGVPKPIAYGIGLQLLWIGFGGAVLLAIIQNKLKGMAEALNVIQIFADGLSYLRLYALGLAGGLMSATFNDLASQTGLVLGFALLLAGHGVNILLSVMAGVIHGLRLNFLEWYHHCFEGGGRMIQPLRLLKIGE